MSTAKHPVANTRRPERHPPRDTGTAGTRRAAAAMGEAGGEVGGVCAPICAEVSGVVLDTRPASPRSMANDLFA
eukprot:CAMPEP_0177257330 /NCGR_PEP_ID=MMETSP0367-20130122/57470_1 /TAXON_ID=447022 ORGANISM="Scrippsiella hangoei-like, Strain SHHI-4" /NCGR_SAMPLE_ID=MMETSP0367 /ASSEMBLY_ACC=CAM_ASM_000362 /LENGTH=73 /DNA_ID=CAMNT_0018711379 /DNA_START=118 /DNA_END=335 /DNA_ORIENTATION=-